MKPGVYTLFLECDSPQRIRIGAIGERDFVPGWYLYVGSALGAGGLDRVCRHIRFYQERYRKPKWHIDYLMEHLRLAGVVYGVTENRLECVLSRAVGGEGVAGFGCSDCECATHLYYRKEMPKDEVMKAFSAVGLLGKWIAVDGEK